jgi:Tol biopolymer transport system component
MKRSKAAAVAGVVLVVALLAGTAGAEAGGGPYTERVSITNAEAEGNGVSDFPSLSGDGRYVAFSSVATNLVTGDTNGKIDVFVRDRTGDTTERVSVTSSEAQVNGDSGNPSISADGRYVAFESRATNLVTGDTNGESDVFVRDRLLGTTIRVSRSTGGTQGNKGSFAPSISADGRYVAFHSYASNLVAGDTNGMSDIFVRDLTTSTTTRVSLNDSEVQGNQGSLFPSISADGRYVAFQSNATNLRPGDTNGFIDIFVRDRTLGVTWRVSMSSGGLQADDDCFSPSISGDGRFVAFDSYATNLVGDDTLGIGDVFVHELETGFTTRMSVNTAGFQGNYVSYAPQISANGRYVAFASLATNLIAADTNNTWDIFVRDRELNTTSRASIATAGTQANGPSSFCAISPDGTFVGFRSDASNLVVGDGNAVTDVFVRYSPPTVVYWSLRGVDRYDTAVKISQATFGGALPDGCGLVLARGDRYQEALCGAPLASAYGGPVLLTPTTGIPTAVRNEILRLAPDYVTLIGLDLWMQDAVDELLGGAATVYLIRGSDVYDMSYKVAEALDARVGGLDGETAIITRGDLFPDALGVAPLACAQPWPILLNNGAFGALHARSAQALTDFGITTVLKVGNYVTMPAGITVLDNLTGADRYVTNGLVADWGVANVGMSYFHIGVTTGEKFPDALAAGPYLAHSAGLLFLTPLSGPLPLTFETNVYANRGSVVRVSFIACIEPVITLVKSLLP